MKLSNSCYDILKWIVIIVLPAIAVLWSKLAAIWNLPYPTEIPDTIGAIHLFLGAILCISTAEYNKTKDDNNEDSSAE